MRNICAKVRVDDREAIMNEFKQIHQQPNKEAAIKVLHAFYDNGTERTTISSEISKR